MSSRISGMATRAEKRLSKSSPYEQMFRTRYRGSGRPVREDGDEEPLFAGGDNHPVLVRTATRRAFAVVHEENRARLRELFAAELRVLLRRGVDQVSTDIGRGARVGEE